MKVLGLTLMALLLVASAGQAQVTINNPGVDVAWTSTFDAVWGSAATRSNPASGGQSGAYFAMTRASGGSSANALQVAINSGQTGNISSYLRRASVDQDHWVEFGYRLGNFNAQDFDANAGSWTLIIKFDGFGIANGTGNANTWTNYTATGVAAGANTQVSLGFKHGASGASSEAGWDTVVVTSPLEIDNWMLY